MTPKKLVELCQQGDEQALSLLYQTYADKMRRICSKYVSDKQTINDLVHDGFIVIYTSIDTLRSPEKLESWMGRIMKNISLRYLEQCHSSTTIPIDRIEADEEPTTSCPEEFPSYDVMLKMIESLPKGYGQIFKLAVLKGYSHKEIGLLLNIAPHSSSSQLSRAKEMLRRLLSQYRITIGLFIISSLISIYILLNTPSSNNKGMSPEIASEPQKTEQEKANSPHRDMVVLPTSLLPMPANLYAHTIPSKEDTLKIKQDSIQQGLFAEKKDDAQSTNQPIIKGQIGEGAKKPYFDIRAQHVSGNDRNWSLALSYVGGEKQTNKQSMINPDDPSFDSAQEIIVSHHHIPITLSLSLRKQINARLGIETGLQYTHLRSDFTTTIDPHWQKTQKVNYLGIPLKGTFNLWNGKRFSIYTSVGTTLDIPIGASSEEMVYDESGQTTSITKKHINPSLQWSAHFGIGLEYRLTPAISIYAEPNLHYYFNNGDNIKTIRTEQPFNLALPIGFRLSW